MRQVRVLAGIAVAVLVAVAGGGCQSAPRARPVKMGDVDTGTGSLEAARRQLEGTWELVSYDVYDAAGKATPMTGTGSLTYDAYGNMNLEARARDRSGELLPMSMNGRVVIDPAQQVMSLADVDANRALQERAPAQIAPDKRRYYSFEGDLLRIEVRDASGKITARSTWRRVK